METGVRSLSLVWSYGVVERHRVDIVYGRIGIGVLVAMRFAFGVQMVVAVGRGSPWCAVVLMPLGAGMMAVWGN